MAQSLDCAFSANYSVFEGGEIGEGMSSMADDILVESTTKKTINDAQLAERTSEILSNYRVFLHEHDMETASKGSLDPPEDGFRELHYYEHRIKNKLSLNHDGNDRATTCLLRDFDVPLGSCDNAPEEKRKNNIMHPIHSLRRARFGAYMIGGLLAVAVLIGVSTAKGPITNEIPTKQNNQAWHSEAAYILDYENVHDKERLPHYDIVVPRKMPLPEPTAIRDLPSSEKIKPTVLEHDFPEDSTGRDAKANVALDEAETTELEVKQVSIMSEPKHAFKLESTEASGAEIEYDPAQTGSEVTSSIASFDLGKILHDKFKPLWLGSREGWNGGSHAEAMKFCNSIRGKELCPYSAMCPYGPGKNVMAGRKPVDFSVQGEQYAPVYGHANRWVLVGQKNGDPSTTCKSHEQLEMRPPVWGLNSDQSEKKLHIMCCTMPQA
eukprot:CAMPEP_0181140928 /NCGR_PEP_ID=MMETSP1071-20121207/35558_1 /TAXON_ID=35127 /ORGANISM="Thalassiosira sp., Strain NH16" /LENGTH=436 /DNA_ID=CAMNT_0023227897 /DNA_START=182 /DNA_END=1492 /DNA_ORIENTATION=-